MDRQRDLKFESVGDMFAEVESLLAGHRTLGGWCFGQILFHLATTVRLSVRDPATSSTILPDPEFARASEVRRRRFFRAGRFPGGVEVPFETLRPPVDAEEQAQAESLREAIRRFDESDGPFAVHPSLGVMSKREWAEFHQMHCAHHLGFATVASPG